MNHENMIQKKSKAQAMLDLALITSNINQLRYIIEYQETNPYFWVSLILVLASIFLQIALGIALITITFQG